MDKMINGYEINGLENIELISFDNRDGNFFRVDLKSIENAKEIFCYFGCGNIDCATLATVTDNLKNKLAVLALIAMQNNFNNIREVALFELNHDQFIFLYELPDWAKDPARFVLQQKYRKIFEEYQELGSAEIVLMGFNGRFNAPQSNSEDISRRDELRKELVGNLQFLTNEQLNVVKNDKDVILANEAHMLLAGRKIDN
jgi:hypothetical protein